MKLRHTLIASLGFLLFTQLGIHSANAQTSAILAAGDADYTAFDYILLEGNVGENDILPEGDAVFQFLNNARYGTIQWEDNSTGLFSYEVDPINIHLHGTGTADSSRYDFIAYSVCVGQVCDTAMIEIFLRHQNDSPIPVPDEYYVETGSSRVCHFGINDLDPDSISDPFTADLTFSPYINPANGSLSFFDAHGFVTYTPNPNFVGDDSFRYVVQDHCGAYAYGIVSIHVIGNNLNPSAGDFISLNATEDDTLRTTIAAYASDPENDPLLFGLANSPFHGIAGISGNGELVYLPAANFIGYDTLRYYVTDLVGQTDTAQIVVQVINANNDAPEAPNQSISAAEDAPIMQSIVFIDSIDGDALTYALQSQGWHGTASISSAGILNYTPEANYTGYDTVYYRSCDSGNLCDVATISIQLLPINDAPQAQNDYNSVPRNTTLDGTVALNDSDIDSPLSTLIYTLQNSAMHGTVALQPNGAYTYQPETVFYGEDSFTYTVCDNNGACASAVVQITVTYANLSPATNDLSIVINEDESLVINLQSVSTDSDGGDLVYEIIDLPSESTFQPIVNVGGNYTPASNWSGILTLPFKVCDTGNLCDTALINITVLPVNDAPVVTSVTFAAQEDGEVNWIPQFSDIDSETLQLHVLTSPNHSELVGDSWVPENNFAGIDSFLFEVCDEVGLCTQSVAYLEVLAVNDPPQAFPLTMNSPEDESIETTLSATDIDSPQYSFYLMSSTSNGTLNLLENGTLLWNPEANFTGVVQAQYRVCDGEGACDTSFIALNITPVNDAPASNFPIIQLQEDAELTWSYSPYLSDVDGDIVFLSLTGSNGVQGTLDPISNTLHFTTGTNYFGSASCSVHVCDMTGTCITDTIQLVIQAVNDAPIAQNPSLVTFQEIVVSNSWYSFATDVDDADLFFNATASFGDLTTDASADFVYTPAEGFTGADSIVFVVCDSSGLCDSGLLIIDVFPPNQAPVALNGTFDMCQGASLFADLSELITDDVLPATELDYFWSSDIPAEFVFDSETSQWIIDPASQFNGVMNIEMTVCDNGSPALCDTAGIVIQINPTVVAQITAASIQQISCNGLNDGSIEIVSVDIPNDVVFEWSTGFQGSSLTNLSPGDYAVSVLPQTVCSVTSNTQFTITEPSVLELGLTANPIIDASGGTIQSSVSGGTPPYMYSWTGPNGYLSTSASAEALSAAGTYELTVTDGNGCEASSQAIVTSLNEMPDLTDVFIYPNPANAEFISIDLHNPVLHGGIVRVFDATGRIVASIQHVQPSTRIEVSEWSPGIYFVEIAGNTKTIIRQFIRTP